MSKCCMLLLFLAFLLQAASAVSSCHPDDLRALQAFAGNLSGGGGVLLRATWSGASCCSWEGVGCDGASGRVTMLSFPGRGLTGPIPGESLTGLARLESLNLANNSRLVGTIKSCIGELDHLCHLDLSHTSLVGEAPKGLQIRLTAVGRSPGMDFTSIPLHVMQTRRALGGQPNTITGTHNAVKSGTRNVVSRNHNTVRSGNYNVVAGNHNTVVTGNDNAVSGNNHVVFGRKHVVTGSYNTVSGSNNAVSGNHHVVSGRNHVVSGSHNTVSGSNNIVSGSNHVVSGNNKVVT